MRSWLFSNDITMTKLCAMCGIWCSYFLFFLTTIAVCSINDYHFYKTDFPSEKIKNYFVGEQRLHRRDAHIESKDTHHVYYNSTITTDPEIGQSFWVDLKNNTRAEINLMLSNSHRKAATVNLSFEFPFYGHLIKNVTISTGGFIYTGDFVHSWLSATQNIAPLMANFDASISNASFVRYMDNGTAFTVEWENIALQDLSDKGEFTFQATLHTNGDIVFVYKDVPFPIGNISDEYHPVKVGLSDAYIMDREIYSVRRRTINEYDRINLVNEEIKNWTVIYLTALPTCLQNQDCYSCITNDIPSFECYWCPNIKRCSSGIDRNRQAWLSNNCQMKQLNESICSESTTLTGTSSAPTTTPIAILTNAPFNTPTTIPSTAESHFHTRTVGTSDSFLFRCKSSFIPIFWRCDGTNDCEDGEDEQGCYYNSTRPSCSKGYFSCDDDRCHPLAYICDENNDCEDGYDEANCTEDSRIYQVLQMGNDSRNSNETSLLLHWFIVQPFDVRLEFLPSISRMWSYDWKNETWTTDSYHRFNNLEPGTMYNMTVYVRIQNTSREFVPAKYLAAQTHEAVIPGSPRNVTVTQFNQSHVILSWNPPVNPNSQIVNYQISWYPHKETKLKVSGKMTSHLLKANFEPETEYSFYITAHNRAHESDKSEVVNLRFNGFFEKSFQSENTTTDFGVTEV